MSVNSPGSTVLMNNYLRLLPVYCKYFINSPCTGDTWSLCETNNSCDINVKLEMSLVLAHRVRMLHFTVYDTKLFDVQN